MWTLSWAETTTDDDTGTVAWLVHGGDWVDPPVWEEEGAIEAWLLISGRSPLLVKAVDPLSALALAM
jgi:hypothetical protein